MKQKPWIVILVAVLVPAILFVPIPTGVYEDGGTRVYSALAYKIVDWNRLAADDFYEATKVYWFPDNLKSIDALWAEEEQTVLHKFAATILELDSSYALVQPVEGEVERNSSDRIALSVTDLGDIGAQVGSKVEIHYTGGIMESSPAQIRAVKWELLQAAPVQDLPEEWLNKETAEKCGNDFFGNIVITEIHSDCFYATTVFPTPYEIKLNGVLSEDWCVGDKVICTYENTYYDRQSQRVEADFLTVESLVIFVQDPSEPVVCYKPVIYLYPEEETEVSVKLHLDGQLTCTYPTYNSGWAVTATPEGTLTDEKGQTYNYLYWEGEADTSWDLSEGFCIRGEDTAAFLEAALEKLGLNRREANEFIVYWLPLMEQNPYNIISFQTDLYTEAAPLEISPTPDTVIRVFMAWKASDGFVELPAQDLTAPDRNGFTVIEWGGTQVKYTVFSLCPPPCGSFH